MGVLLRDVRPEDKEQMRTWRNKPAVSQYMYTDHHIAPEEHERWFKSILTDPARRYWIIVSDDRDVGTLNLMNIDLTNKHCYFGWYIGEESERGKGVGIATEFLLLCHVFEELKLNKLYAEVLVSNVPVVTLYKSMGFKEEGLLRQHIFKGGKPEDVVTMGILQEEWATIKPQIEERLREAQSRRARASS